MFIKCLCGNTMNDIAAPNQVEHLLLSSAAMEKLQDLVDGEVSSNREIELWPEHWEESGAISVWKCPDCGRLYLNVSEDADSVVVYKFEQKGVTEEQK